VSGPILLAVIVVGLCLIAYPAAHRGNWIGRDHGHGVPAGPTPSPYPDPAGRAQTSSAPSTTVPNRPAVPAPVAPAPPNEEADLIRDPAPFMPYSMD